MAAKAHFMSDCENQSNTTCWLNINDFEGTIGFKLVTRAKLFSLSDDTTG